MRRKGFIDPRWGIALAAVFIIAFIALLTVAQIQPTIEQNIPQNSTVYQTYQDFNSYVGKSFSMWGLALFISVIGLIVGAIYSFLGQ